ncbi:MAG TPA: pyruvate kinase [Methylocystis sp.]|nr:pyruvate kinase [Methylocystis sp.]
MHSREISRNIDAELRELLAQVSGLRDDLARESAALIADWGGVGALGDFAHEARNLADYLALRRRDVSPLQRRLSSFGLSSLGRSEAKVQAALEALVASLRRLTGESDAPYPPPRAMREGEDALLAASERIFGAKSGDPHTRVMATLPSEAANDPQLLKRLIAAGMDCARINCAHDDAGAWARMIANVKIAASEAGRACPVLMDVAGPKCRIEKLRAAPKYRAHVGDRLLLVADLESSTSCGIAIQPSFPQLVGALEIGAPLWINDGKVGARVVAKAPGEAEIEITCARSKGHRLKAEKGLNFPSTALEISPLTPKDFADLDFVAEQADLVGYSFVQTPQDIELLQDELARRRRGKGAQPLVLKIETPVAVHNLPRLIVASARRHPTAVMIARGDLAVELGFARLSEIQEEMLWLCEAAHVPVIWATQVLDQFVHEGVLNRAETTDAAMAQRAECVMLNKGPHLVEGVAFLRDILLRMDRHYAKKFARFAPLKAWD